MTLAFDPAKDPDVHVYELILRSPIPANTITSTVPWGGQQTSEISLLIAPREHGVVNTDSTEQNMLVPNNSLGTWHKISANNDNTECTKHTTTEIEFFIRANNKPIFFSNVDLRPGQIEFINSTKDKKVNRTIVQIDNADSFDYWGGAKVPPTEETWCGDSGHGQKQSLLLSVVGNTAMIDPKYTYSGQPVTKLEIGTNNSNLPQKDYHLQIAMYDNDPIGTGSSYYYLHLDDDKSNHNAFTVTLDVAGQETAKHLGNSPRNDRAHQKAGLSILHETGRTAGGHLHRYSLRRHHHRRQGNGIEGSWAFMPSGQQSTSSFQSWTVCPVELKAMPKRWIVFPFSRRNLSA